MANQVGSNFYSIDTAAATVVVPRYAHVNAITVSVGTAGPVTITSGGKTIFTSGAITDAIIHLTYATPQVFPDGLAVTAVGTGGVVYVFVH